MNDIERIKNIYKEYWKCMIDKDAEGLRGLMSDDYYLMHMTGTRQSADEFICINLLTVDAVCGMAAFL